MTQEGLETILSEYVQIMDSFKAGNINEAKDDPTNSIEQDNVNDKVQPLPSSHHQIEDTKPPERSSSVGSTTSTTTTKSYVTTASSVSSAALPTPPARHDMTEQRRKSFRLNQQRISWTSDTGLTSFAASQHLAGELMSLFDMEFKVDISLDPYSAPAPQLPELSYFTEKQQHRSSVDSFMCLIPAFESFQIDSQDGLSFVSKANKRTSILAGGGTTNRRISSSLAPTRSSSLKYKNGTQQSSSRGHSNNDNSNDNNSTNNHVETSSKNRSPQQYSISTSEMQDRRPLTKKKSIRKLVSLFGKKRLNSETALPLDHQSPLPVKSSSASMSTPSLSHSTLANSTSSYNAITPSSLVSTSSSSTTAPLPVHRVITSPGAANPISTHKDITPPTSATDSPSDTYTTLMTSPTHQQSAPPTTTTRAQRRRSNSVPGISTTFLNQINEEQKHREYRQSHHTQPLPFEVINHTNTTQQFSQSNIYPPSPITPITGGNDEETGKYPLPQSISSYELSSYGRLERNQSLSRSSAALGQQQQYQLQQLQQQQQQQQHHQYHHQHQDMRQYHSTHDLSRIYTNGHTNNSNSGGSDESKESMTLTSPTSPKKPSSSSFLQRMTTFARRKKPANALKQSSSHSLVPA
ncbi:unnamed protein product [Absidia cylindrospora]